MHTPKPGRVSLALLALVCLGLVACGPSTGQPAETATSVQPTGTATPAPPPDTPTQAPPAETPTTDEAPGGQGATPTAAGQITGLAAVETVDVKILESFPVQVQVTAKGNLPDGCTTIDKVQQKQNGNAFEVTITTTRPADAACITVLMPFEKTVALNVQGLKAGTYTVSVNGVNTNFTLSSDNALR
jgi:hypothetical protein